jgi:regulator of protease activity HflC (stomatin/prohibitin superfamily)
MNFIKKAGIGIAAGALVLIGTFNSVFVYNEAGYQTHIRTITGEEKVVTEVGYATKWFGKATPWKQAQTLQFSIVKEGETSREVDDGVGIDNYRVTFLGNVDGVVEASTRFRMPQGEQFLKIAREYRTPDNFMQTAVLPAVKETLQTTASLMTADEYFAGSRSEFSSNFDDQLRNGQFAVKRKEVQQVIETNRSEGDKLVSGAGIDGEQKRTAFVTEKETDDKGREVRKSQVFVGMGVDVVEARVPNILPNPQFLARMVKVQSAQADLVVARADRLKEEEAKLLAIARGQRNVEEKRQETLRNQVEQTTNAETTKLLAITAAKQAEESAAISKRTSVELLAKAEIDAKATKTTADAEAYAKKALILADGALTQKLATLENINSVWAQAAANAPVPSVMMGNGGGQGSSRQSEIGELMSIMAAKAAKDLSVDLSTK